MYSNPYQHRRKLILAAALATAISMFSGIAPDPVSGQSQLYNIIVQVELDADVQPEGLLGPSELNEQQATIDEAQDELLGAVSQEEGLIEVGYVYETAPFIALTVDEAGLEALRNNPDIVSIQENELHATQLSTTTSLVGAAGSGGAWAQGFDGTGQTVVIIDTGIDQEHPFFGSKIVSQACYSNLNGFGGGISLCPGGVASSTASNAADVDDQIGTQCVLSNGTNLCDHGTHVASIAAGNDPVGSLDGVARGASIIPIQVFTRFNSTSTCGGSSPCVLAYTADIDRGLERAYALRGSYNIASVNLSLGGSGRFTSACDSQSPSTTTVVNNLTAAGIAVVAASGNDGFTNGMNSPACISNVISVGSTTKADAISGSSNRATFLDTFAPGSSIQAAVPYDSNCNSNCTAFFSGTSMASPHVAGAVAILKQARPNGTLTELVEYLKQSPYLFNVNGVNVPRLYLPSSMPVFVDSATLAPGATWMESWINRFYARGITTGCAANPARYCPNDPVTRAQMSVFILRADNYGSSYGPPPGAGIFADVPTGMSPGTEWMQPWIEEFYRQGITTGCAANPVRYCPNDVVTRAQMAVFILRAINPPGYQPPPVTGIFADVPTGMSPGTEWMQPWIEEFYRQGITTGCAANPARFCPNDTVTRAQMAVFILRAYANIP